MCTTDLQIWPIFGMLESEFVSQIHMVMVYGSLGDEALIVTKDKMVYGLSNDRGRYRRKNERSKLYPEKMEALCGKNIKTLACSDAYGLMLTQEGTMHSWGTKIYYDLEYLDHERLFQPFNSPDRLNISTLEDSLRTKCFVEVACGGHHSVALTKDGEVYTWKQDNFKQMLRNRRKLQAQRKFMFEDPWCCNFSHDVCQMKEPICRINIENTIVKVACGYAHTLALTDKGKLHVWGRNNHGQLGIGNYKDRRSPCQVSTLTDIVIVKVTCGHSHTLALTNKGVLYAWGDNNYGQLGIGNKSEMCNPVMVGMGKVVDIAAVHYNNISIAVGEGGCIYMWGHCRGQSITTPIITPFSYIHDVLACYGLPSVMHEPLILQPKKESSILECLNIAFDDPSTSDLTIEVDDQCIHVHKAILQIRSSHFRDMFQNNSAENNQSVIKLDDFSYVVYKAYLKYLYTDVIDLAIEKAFGNSNFVTKLMVLADMYHESDLKEKCSQLIKN